VTIFWALQPPTVIIIFYNFFRPYIYIYIYIIIIIIIIILLFYHLLFLFLFLCGDPKMGYNNYHEYKILRWLLFYNYYFGFKKKT
jgi:hypothetical protein